MSSAWIYCENNTRDRQQRDIRCRSICQHHWGPLTGHSVAPLHALRVAATAVWAPAPSFRARGRETARRREEAPSRASPVSNQKRTEGRTPTAVKGRPKDARHRANCFRPTKATLQPGSRRRAGLSRDVAFHCKLSDYEPIISRSKAVIVLHALKPEHAHCREREGILGHIDAGAGMGRGSATEGATLNRNLQ